MRKEIFVNQNFYYALEIMLKGMAGVFIVILIIAFAAFILEKLTSK